MSNSKDTRRCVSCYKMKHKSELFRVVRLNNGDAAFDRGMKINGRGAYVCRLDECLKAARKGRKLERSLKMQIKPEIYQMLEMQI